MLAPAPRGEGGDARVGQLDQELGRFAEDPLTGVAPPDRVTDLSRVLFEESPTIGVRWTAYQRERLDREMVTLTTTYGAIHFKVSRLDGRVVTVTPELDEVRRIARAKGLPVREARAEGRRLLP